MTFKLSNASFIALLPIFLSPVYSWSATQYIEVYTTVNELGSFTVTETVFPTGAVTPIDTSTGANDILGEVTVVDLILSGSNLPVSTPYVTDSILDIYQPPPYTGVSSVFFAPITITAPPTCTKTTFSYSTNLPVTPPKIMWNPPNSLPIISSAAFMTTTFYTNADGQPTASSSWSEIDFYLPAGQELPTLNYDTNLMLRACQDPRGCYLGKGEGCRETGAGIAETGSGSKSPSSTSTATATKNGGSSLGRGSSGIEKLCIWALVWIAAPYGTLIFG